MKVLPLCPVAELLIFLGDPMLEPGNTNHVVIYVYRLYIYIYVYMNNTYNVYVYMIWYRCIL